ncbi:MAG: hypothetical protein JWO94_2477 [Verrucomicrobiaceae bacterium]|nr:hypothetical protein [Verrucomicrobiaceae bacterium]
MITALSSRLPILDTVCDNVRKWLPLAVCAALSLGAIAQQPAPAKPVVPDLKEADKNLPPMGGKWGLREAVVKDATLPNVLLIGDSILGGYLASVQKALEGKANIDAWVTPINQADKQLPKILTEMLGAKKYAVIHFNLGLHGWQKGRIPEGQYEPLTRQMVETMKKAAPQAKLVWASITPVTVKGEPGRPNPEIQPTIEMHNAMATKIMEEEGVATNDLAGLMQSHLKLAAGDMFHWTPEGREMQAKAVASSVSKLLPGK